ncbi:MAG: hypothetical protein AAFV86_00680 [Pseudomonadota bacterium]
MLLDEGETAHPSRLVEAGDRTVWYRLEAVNDWWWRLTVYLDVRHTFQVFPGARGARAEPDYASLKRRFKTYIEDFWTRRWHVRATGTSRFSLTAPRLPVTEVRVEVRERAAGDVANRRFWIVDTAIGARQRVRTQYRNYDRGAAGDPVGVVWLDETCFRCVDLAIEGRQIADRQLGVVHEGGHMLGMDHPNHTDPDPHREYLGEHQDEAHAHRIASIGMGVSNLDYRWARRMMTAIAPDYTWALAPSGRAAPRRELACTA